MDYIDDKYIHLLSSRLDKFKKLKPKLYNFRCPICGDSKKNKNKRRGFLYEVKNNTNFKCHNCGASMSLSNFINTLDPQLHKEYIFEKFKTGNTGRNFVTESPEDIFQKLKDSKPTFNKGVEINLPNAFEVDKSRNYLETRAIFEGEFYYAENFKEFVNSIKPYTFDSVEYGEERIVIPLIKDGKLIGIQGRALSSNPVKYLTIMLDENEPKIYGMNTLKENETVYVCEGPFDSTFLDNGVALCGSDGDVSCLSGSDIVYVYDNEPRNREITKKIEKVIEDGGRVVIWPNTIHQKDINDMVLSGHDVKNVVGKNIYSGLEAKLKFTTWKRT